IKNAAPYKSVTTVGWTLDEQGRAFSKSLGNGVDPVAIADKLGAEIVRLWAASVDFREDVAASDNLMQRAAENYRKLRNTFKFLLGNLHGFDPAQHRIADEQLLPLDRYMLARTRELTEKVLDWYKAFEFHRVYHAVNEFTIVDLSALYLDVLKDRMYTFAPTSIERRSAQTVLWKITETLVRLIAPILAFTAEEVWSYLPPTETREPSVHLALFRKPEEIIFGNTGQILYDFTILLRLRSRVLRKLEDERRIGRIGKALEAKVQVELVAGFTYFKNSLQRYHQPLKELFNVSHVDVNDPSAEISLEDSGRYRDELENGQISDELLDYAFNIQVLPADGQKCNRCWNYRTDTAQYGPWSNVCGRCTEALNQMGYKSLQESHA
ncbi:MAG: class I tRNA ligase family protein, partial [Acidobacteriaceae bacterium]